jgi:multidrug efflux pump
MSKLGVRNSRSAAWFNLQPSVLLVVTKQADANVIDTVDRIYEMLPELKRWIPADVQISVLSDRTTTIRASIRDMQWTLLATIVLVMLVVFLFLPACRRDLLPQASRCRWRWPARAPQCGLPASRSTTSR